MLAAAGSFRSKQSSEIKTSLNNVVPTGTMNDCSDSTTSESAIAMLGQRPPAYYTHYYVALPPLPAGSPPASAAPSKAVLDAPHAAFEWQRRYQEEGNPRLAFHAYRWALAQHTSPPPWVLTLLDAGFQRYLVGSPTITLDVALGLHLGSGRDNGPARQKERVDEALILGEMISSLVAYGVPITFAMEIAGQSLGISEGSYEERWKRFKKHTLAQLIATRTVRLATGAGERGIQDFLARWVPSELQLAHAERLQQLWVPARTSVAYLVSKLVGTAGDHDGKPRGVVRKRPVF